MPKTQISVARIIKVRYTYIQIRERCSYSNNSIVTNYNSHTFIIEVTVHSSHLSKWTNSIWLKTLWGSRRPTGPHGRQTCWSRGTVTSAHPASRPCWSCRSSASWHRGTSSRSSSSTSGRFPESYPSQNLKVLPMLTMEIIPQKGFQSDFRTGF